MKVTINQTKPFKFLDIIVALVFFATTLVVFFAFKPVQGAVVVITTSETKYTYDLDKDQTIKLEHLTIQIKDKKVKVVQSDCYDHTCQQTSAIWGEGQTILCLPNATKITIQGHSSGVDGEL